VPRAPRCRCDHKSIAWPYPMSILSSLALRPESICYTLDPGHRPKSNHQLNSILISLFPQNQFPAHLRLAPGATANGCRITYAQGSDLAWQAAAPPSAPPKSACKSRPQRPHRSSPPPHHLSTISRLALPSPSLHSRWRNMPHQAKESTSTAASLHSDALSTVPSTASSLDARPSSPLAIIDVMTGLPLLQKPGDAPDLPVADEQSIDLPLRDHMASPEPARAVSDAAAHQNVKRTSPPAPRKKTHFAEQLGLAEDGVSNSADALRIKSPVIVELRTNVIVCTWSP
jgi:hypothetical protein